MSLRRLLWTVDRHHLDVEWSRDYADDVECFREGDRSVVGCGTTWADALADLLRQLGAL